jgi:acyl-homoserine lactone acylase PvdQ
VYSTDKLSIGLTSITIDNADIYEEKIKDGKYLFKGKYYPLEIREEIVKVKGGKSIRFDINSTIHGPLIGKEAQFLNLLNPRYVVRFKSGHYSLKWTGFDTKHNNIIQGFYRSLEADNVFEQLEIITGRKMPQTKTDPKTLVQSYGFSQNMMFADVYGNIAMAPMGTFVKSKLLLILRSDTFWWIRNFKWMDWRRRMGRLCATK